MGLGGFLQDLLGSKNTFQAQPMQLDKVDYSKGIDEAQKAAIGSLNAGAGAGEMQKTLAQKLMEQAEGTGPSLAQMQLKEASENALKGQIGAIASQRGMNPAQAARAAALIGSQQQQALAGQGAQLRLQEQMQKQQLLNQALQAQRQLDISQQGANVGTLGTFGQLSQAQQNAALENYWNAQKINAGVEAQNVAGANALMGGLLQAGAGLGAASITSGGSLFGGGGGGSSAGAGGTFGLMGRGQSSPRMSLFGGNTPQLAEGGQVDEATPADYSGDPEFRTVRVSPGEKVVNSDGSVMKVPGKAKHPGDDERNDTVVADLRRDSIVVPRTKSGDKEKMIEFLKHIKESSKKKSDLQELMDAHKEIQEKLEDLKYKMGKWRPK